MLSSYPSNSVMHQSLTTMSKGTLTNELMRVTPSSTVCLEQSTPPQTPGKYSTSNQIFLDSNFPF